MNSSSNSSSLIRNTNLLFDEDDDDDPIVPEDDSEEEEEENEEDNEKNKMITKCIDKTRKVLADTKKYETILKDDLTDELVFLERMKEIQNKRKTNNNNNNNNIVVEQSDNNNNIIMNTSDNKKQHGGLKNKDFNVEVMNKLDLDFIAMNLERKKQNVKPLKREEQAKRAGCPERSYKRYLMGVHKLQKASKITGIDLITKYKNCSCTDTEISKIFKAENLNEEEFTDPKKNTVKKRKVGESSTDNNNNNNNPNDTASVMRILRRIQI